MRLWRAHGLGNDYLVLEEGPPLDAALVVALCDRHHGVGGDGVLEPVETTAADHGVRIWNPDGSTAEKSGNGLRIFAHWLSRRRDRGDRFSVHTGTDRVDCEVEGDQVRVAMGTARFEVGRSPTRPSRVGAALAVGGTTLSVVAVDLGNPHCVVFREEPDLDALPWRDWGGALERHSAFPNRTNVQVARVLDRSTAEARVWERGAGATLASGSSACAVAAAGVRQGLLDAGEITVRMPGGALFVRVEVDLEVHLRGPVEAIGVVEVAPSWLAARARSGLPAEPAS